MLAKTPRAFGRARSTFIKAIAGVLAVTTTALFAGVGAASAAAGDSSSARGQFLSGSLLGTDLATLAELEGAEAVSDGSADVVESDPLSVAVLQALQLDLAGGLQVPLDVVDLGVLDQYAAADADGSSLGASGAVAGDGGIGVGPVGPGGAPTAFSLQLSQLLAGVVNVGAITDLELELGAVSAQATGDGVSAPTGDYEIAGLRLVMDSPAIAGVSASVETAVDGVVDPLVDDLVGPGGSVLSTLTGAVPLLTLGVVGAGATLDVDLDAALDPLIGPAAPALGAGSPIEIDLGSGEITVDVRALLEADADPGNDLNNLPPNTEILSAAVLTLIADGVESLLDDLADDIAAAVVTAVNSAVLDLDLTVTALGITAASVAINGSVADIVASAPGVVQVTILDAGICGVPVVGALVCGTLDAVLTGALDTLLTAAVAGLVDDVLAGVQADVIAPVLALLDPALASVVTGIVSLRANVQEPTPPVLGAEFVETALRLTLLGGVTVPGGGAAVLDIAQAAVGPNVAVDPVASDLDPDRGPETGGTVVTITGTAIGDATGVTFGGVPGTAIVRVSDDEITVTSPPHAPGTVDVVVTGPGGATAPLPFEYFAVVTIDDITPDQGPEAGGNVVVITGHCFTATTSVTFDGVPAAFVVDSDTQLTVTVPAGTGLVDVTVVTSDADCGSGTEPDGYAYVAPGAPDITGMVPDRGPETGGTAVTITGTGFLGADGVTFDGIAGTSFVVVNDTTITVVSPPHAPATVGVIVTHPANGDSSPEDFEYYPVITIDDITPDEGPETGGTVVVITGHCFLGATGVTFDGVAATSFTVDSDTQITATVPAGTGLVDVVVAGVGDCGDGDLPDGFQYLPSPVITGLLPPTGPETGGTAVTITGTGFLGSTAVTIDGTPVAFTVVNDTTITVTTPPHAPGSVPVVVLHPVQDSAPQPFLYYPVTTIDDVSPDQGPEAGGTAVVILGHCFTGATQVLFGGIPAASFVVVNDGRIEAVTAPGTGLVDVQVVGAGTCGTGTEPDAFAFVGPLAPVITDIDPDQGPQTGNTLVTITGTGFLGVTSVTFDGIPGTALTVLSDTELTVRTPPHAPEVVDVIVIHPVNGAGAPVDFEYIAAGVGGVTVTPGGLALTGSSPLTGILGAILLLLTGLGLVIAAGLRRRPRLL